MDYEIRVVFRPSHISRYNAECDQFNYAGTEYFGFEEAFLNALEETENKVKALREKYGLTSRELFIRDNRRLADSFRTFTLA